MPEFDWIDLSYPISRATPPFPGDPAVEISVLDQTSESSDQPRQHLNCSRVAMCVHCGTHMDAPFHFFGNGQTIDQIPLGLCHGVAHLLDLRDELEDVRQAVITDRMLADTGIERLQPTRLILLTGWSSHWLQADYFDSHPVLTREAARLLVDFGVKLLGVDFPSVDQRPNEAHLELLGRGTLIVENLTRLESLGAGPFEFSAIPLALVGRDGSPVRAIGRPLAQT